ncbi:Transposase and inactivated derivatives [Alteromonadaceae bacterium Bs31]|nr:Transposase and inactivated derivatives [Alteromonadaceae bacterium Bs31]
MHRSSYRYRQLQKGEIDLERARLTEKIIALHTASRGAAGARTISGQLKQEGEAVGRYRAKKLMEEANIESKQPSHTYKKATQESVIAENHLARQFTVAQANTVWCGDVTYIWSGQQWLFLAIVLDLYKRKLVG